MRLGDLRSRTGTAPGPACPPHTQTSANSVPPSTARVAVVIRFTSPPPRGRIHYQLTFPEKDFSDTL